MADGRKEPSPRKKKDRESHAKQCIRCGSSGFSEETITTYPGGHIAPENAKLRIKCKCEICGNTWWADGKI